MGYTTVRHCNIGGHWLFESRSFVNNEEFLVLESDMQLYILGSTNHCKSILKVTAPNLTSTNHLWFGQNKIHPNVSLVTPLQPVSNAMLLHR